MELAAQAEISSRHLCFLETGRSQPSRDSVLALARALDMPLREQNRFLIAAGFAPRFHETPYLDDSMAHVREVVRFLLGRHEPFGAVALDADWNILDSNDAFWNTLESLTEGAVSRRDPANVLALFAEPSFRERVLNWDEVAMLVSARLSREAIERRPLDAPRAQAWTLTAQQVLDQPPALLVPIHFQFGGDVVQVFSTFTTLGTPIDVTLQELKIETYLPADESSERILRKLGSGR